MARKIRILILTHSFPTKFNPIAAIFLLNQLKELKKHCEIKVIYPHGYAPKFKIFNPYHRFSKIPYEEKIEGIPVYHPKYLMIPRISHRPPFFNVFLSIESFISYLMSMEIADKIMKEWNPDIVHMHGSLSEGWLAKRLKRKYKKPLLITVYGEDITRLAKEWFTAPIIKSNLRESEAIICQSVFLRKEIESIGVRNKKFFIIPMGVMLDRFKVEDKLKAREVSGIPKGKKVILFVGHLIPRKGVEYLIKAMRILVDNNDDIFCCIVGKDHQNGKLQKMASELDLGKCVLFAGEKNHEELPPYMNSCDVFVLPSLNEGLPVVLCEALACGKPVVATRVAGTPELVDEDVGYLVEPKDEKNLAEKILLAISKKWDKKKILKRASEFSTAASAEKLIKVYRGCLK